MKFLGLAAGFSAKDAFCHLFACGKKTDSEELHRLLAEKYQASADRVVLYHTGRSALAAAIEAVTPKGSEVAIACPTCVAVVRAVRAAGCVPVLVDAAPGKIQFGPQELKARLEGGTKVRAVIIQNTLGETVDITAIGRICQEHQVAIIEDLAHCVGRHYPDGREVGTVGAAVALSFGKGKSIDTTSGGAVIIRDADASLPRLPAFKPRLSDRLRDRWYPFFGLVCRGLWRIKVGKAILALLVKLHLIQKSADAALNLDVRLTHWQAKLAARQLQRLDASRPLRGHAFVEQREKVLAALEQSGFYFREIWYDTLISPARYQHEVTVAFEQLPGAVRAAQEVINWPNYCTEKDLTQIRSIIKEYEVKS